MTNRNRRMMWIGILLAAAALLAVSGGQVGPTAASSGPGASGNALDPAKEVTLDLGNKVTMKLVLVPAGKFTMGSPDSEQRDVVKAAGAVGMKVYDAREWFESEGPQHEVTISRPFYVGVHAVTQEQYEQVMGKNPSSFKGAQNPVEMVSWDDAVEFCKKLSAKTGKALRLPTEAEWEYACRAATTTPFHTGETIAADQANYDGSFTYGSGVKGENREKTTTVGSFKANAFGLYDMHGNVWQWCADWYDAKYYGNSPKADPTGPADGKCRVVRGGSWRGYPWICRSAYRGGFEPDVRLNSVGFRVVDMGPAGLAEAQWAAAASDVTKLERQKATPASQPQSTPWSPADMNTRAQIEGLPDGIEVLANRGGFCLDLGCGDGKLAAEIAQKTQYSVFALAKNDADCAKAREALDQTNLYGTRAGAVAGSLKTLPFPNFYGNLIVTGDYQDTLDLKEVVRVLNPNGMAVIGGGKTDAAKLKSALDTAGIKDYKVVANYAVIRGKMPEGMDDWTHFGHGPDNIRTSRETVVRPPFRTQWMLANPAHDDSPVQHPAIAQGRIIFRNTLSGKELDHYYSYDSFNGALLWERPVPTGGRNNFRYAFVDGVCYWLGYRGVIDAFDAEMGKQITEYRIPGADYSWWLAVENGTLYALGRVGSPVQGDLYGMANLFCAFDLKSGRVLWQHECKTLVQMASAAMDGAGGLYFFDIEREGSGKNVKGTGVAHCLDAKTGEERWHADLGRVWTRYNDMGAAGCIDGKYFVWSCTDEKGVQGTKAFDGKTGQLARDYPGVHSYAEGLAAPLLFVDGKIYNNWNAGHNPYRCIDIATGADAKTAIAHLGASDDAGNASATCLYAGGEGGSVYDLVAGKLWRNYYFRTSDFAAPFPANGMLLYFPAVCHCPHAFEAPLALAPAGLDWTPPDADKDIASRLVPGPAFDTPLVAAGNQDWTHYRGNPGHTGETATAPKTPLAMGWERKLGGRLTPRPLVAAWYMLRPGRDAFGDWIRRRERFDGDSCAARAFA